MRIMISAEKNTFAIFFKSKLLWTNYQNFKSGQDLTLHWTTGHALLSSPWSGPWFESDTVYKNLASSQSLATWFTVMLHENIYPSARKNGLHSGAQGQFLYKIYIIYLKYFKILLRLIRFIKDILFKAFLGNSLAVRIPHSHCRGPRFSPWWGN